MPWILQNMPRWRQLGWSAAKKAFSTKSEVVVMSHIFPGMRSRFVSPVFLREKPDEAKELIMQAFKLFAAKYYLTPPPYPEPNKIHTLSLPAIEALLREENTYLELLEDTASSETLGAVLHQYKIFRGERIGIGIHQSVTVIAASVKTDLHLLPTITSAYALACVHPSLKWFSAQYTSACLTMVGSRGGASP